MSSPPSPPVPDGGGPSPFVNRQQRQEQEQLQHPDYSFSGRVLLTAVVILAMLTVVFVLIRLLLYQFVARGRGSLALGVRRSFGRRSVRHGLDASALAALPVTTYRVRRADGGGGDGDGSSSVSGTTSASAAAADCAVCLSELADGEKVRALPDCGHVFHVDCVDAWLRSRTTCPVCRAEVRPKATAGIDARPSPPPALIGAAGATLVVTVEGGGAAETGDARRTSVLGFGQPSGAVG